MSKKHRRSGRAAARVRPIVTAPSRGLAPARRLPAPANWMLFGALAAGAAFGSAAEARSGAVGRSAERIPALTRVVDRYRGVADLDGFAEGAYLASGGGGGALDPAAGWAVATGISFDIAAGPLADVLHAYSLQTGLRVELSPPELGEVGSPGVSGVLSSAEALERLLDGTGARVLARDRARVKVGLAGLSEAVEVVAPPRLASPKQPEALLDTPQSVTVVSAELLEQQGAISLRDALRNVTGISIQAGEGGGGLPGDNLAIRGFAARNDLFVDGVRDFGAYSRDPFNVEQVEVSKGPASVFSGRGSTGGAVNLATKTPTLEPDADVAVSVGSAELARVTVDLNRPVGGDALGGSALRLNAMFTTADTAGRDEVTSRRHGLAASWAAGLRENTRVWLNGSWMAEENLPDYGIPWVPANNQALAGYADQPAPVDFDNFYGLVDRDFEKTRNGLATAIVEHDFGPGATLRTLVRGGRSERDSVITAPRFASPDSTDLNRQLQARDLADDIVDGQADLDLRFSTGSIEHRVVTGVELSREASENRGRTAPAAPLADLWHPDPRTPYHGELSYTGARTESRADTAAAYAFDTVRLGEKVEAMGGLRFDRFEIDYDNRAASGDLATFGRSDDMLSWRAGVVYKPRPEGSVYAAFGTSFNPAADANTGLALTDATVLLDPEESRSAELGAKWELADRRLLATAAIFETEKVNARTPGLSPDDPPTVLEGRQRVRGAEVGLTGRIGERWTAVASYTYLDSEVTESNTPSEVGHELPNTPRHSLSLWATYRPAPALEIGGGVQYVDDRYNNVSNVRVAPSYTKLDATAAWDVTDSLTLRLNLENLADERYIDRVGGGHFIPGAGRSASLTAGVRF